MRRHWTSLSEWASIRLSSLRTQSGRRPMQPGIFRCTSLYCIMQEHCLQSQAGCMDLIRWCAVSGLLPHQCLFNAHMTACQAFASLIRPLPIQKPHRPILLATSRSSPLPSGWTGSGARGVIGRVLGEAVKCCRHRVVRRV